MQDLHNKNKDLGEVVVAHLLEQSLSIPEVRGSNPVIGKNLYWIFTVNCLEKMIIKKKEAGNGPQKNIALSKNNLADLPFIRSPLGAAWFI